MYVLGKFSFRALAINVQITYKTIIIVMKYLGHVFLYKHLTIDIHKQRQYKVFQL